MTTSELDFLIHVITIRDQEDLQVKPLDSPERTEML